MADQIDVVNQLIAAAALALYPTGPATGTTPSPAAGAVVSLRPGYPNADEIDAALKAGAILVGCYPDPGEQSTTRFDGGWHDLATSAPTLTATTGAKTIAIGGTVSTPQNVGAAVNGKTYVYAVQPADTLATIAAGLAALVAVDTPATVAGSTVTIAAATSLAAATGAAGTSIREIGRARKSYRLIFWAPSPALRDAAAAPVDKALRDVRFLTLADGSAARVVYQRSDWIEVGLKDGLFRRDLVFSVEHALTDVAINNAVLFAVTAFVVGGQDPAIVVTTPIVTLTESASGVVARK